MKLVHGALCAVALSCPTAAMTAQVNNASAPRPAPTPTYAPGGHVIIPAAPQVVQPQARSMPAVRSNVTGPTYAPGGHAIIPTISTPTFSSSFSAGARTPPSQMGIGQDPPTNSGRLQFGPMAPETNTNTTKVISSVGSSGIANSTPAVTAGQIHQAPVLRSNTNSTASTLTNLQVTFPTLRQTSTSTAAYAGGVAQETQFGPTACAATVYAMIVRGVGSATGNSTAQNATIDQFISQKGPTYGDAVWSSSNPAIQNAMSHVSLGNVLQIGNGSAALATLATELNSGKTQAAIIHGPAVCAPTAGCQGPTEDHYVLATGVVKSGNAITGIVANDPNSGGTTVIPLNGHDGYFTAEDYKTVTITN